MTPSPAHHLTLWLIEDHRAFSRELASHLETMERVQQVRCLGSGEAALACEKPVPDVILLDLGLPGISGVELLPLLRQRWPETPITVLTVFADDEKIFGSLCAGATGYLLKTSGIEAVHRAVLDAAAGESPISPSIASRVLKRLTPPPKSLPATSALSPQERRVLEQLVQGCTTKEVAARLEVSVHTVDCYLRRIYQKLHVRSRSAAVAIAVREGL
jgi:DNA-binding NarL/FixJ family response regulator